MCARVCTCGHGGAAGDAQTQSLTHTQTLSLPSSPEENHQMLQNAAGSSSASRVDHRAGASLPTGAAHVCVCGRCGACAQGSAHTHTRFCPSSLRTHVSLLRVCDEPTPTQLSVQMVHPTQRWGFPDSLVAEESTCNAGDPGSIPGWGRSSGEGVGYPLQDSWAAPAAQLVKNLPAVRETWVRSLAWEDLLEKGKAPHSSVLAWRTPWAV